MDRRCNWFNATLRCRGLYKVRTLAGKCESQSNKAGMLKSIFDKTIQVMPMNGYVDVLYFVVQKAMKQRWHAGTDYMVTFNFNEKYLKLQSCHRKSEIRTVMLNGKPN